MFLEYEGTNFVSRIKEVEENDIAKYGKMNVHQMIFHCADQFSMLFGEIEGLKRENVDLREMREKLQRNESVRTVNGLDQSAGKGTKPTTFEQDKELLISYINKFSECERDYKFSFHPFIGEVNGEYWERVVIHHLNHHLTQFGR